ncbi:MAG: glycine betaine ABC transporter substrate-binding protein, partial [Mahellales bacterium]
MLTKKTKRVGSLLICIAMIISLAFTITACGSNNDDNPAIKVTCKPWTEQLILGNMLMSLLEENGYPVEDRLGLGEDPVIRPALHSGEVDVYWEYTGTTLITLMEHDVVTDPQEAYNLVKEWDETNNEVTWLKYATANNTYTLMMRQAQAKELGIESISDLASYIKENPNEITLGTNNEFYERADG